jgi:chaperonin cofactor prefoldin
MTCDMKLMSVNMHRINTDICGMLESVHKRIDTVKKRVKKIKDSEQKMVNNIYKGFHEEITKLKQYV